MIIHSVITQILITLSPVIMVKPYSSLQMVHGRIRDLLITEINILNHSIKRRKTLLKGTWVEDIMMTSYRDANWRKTITTSGKRVKNREKLEDQQNVMLRENQEEGVKRSINLMKPTTTTEGVAIKLPGELLLRHTNILHI